MKRSAQIIPFPEPRRPEGTAQGSRIELSAGNVVDHDLADDFAYKILGESLALHAELPLHGPLQEPD